MPQTYKKNYIAGAALLLIFCIGITQLFLERFSMGDTYPPYSSLRADPLGTKVLFEALEGQRWISAERNYSPMYRMEKNPDATYFLLGSTPLNPKNAEAKSFESLMDLVRSGARLVVALTPQRSFNYELFDEDEKEEKKKNAPESSNEDEVNKDEVGENEADETKADEIEVDKDKPDKDKVDKDKVDKGKKPTKKLSAVIGLVYDRLPQGKGGLRAFRDHKHKGKLPKSISWNSSLYFAELDDAWQVLYRFGGKPAIVERQLGKGTIVLSADSYFFSNEAMRSERWPTLLKWFTGNKAKVVFDEKHLGIARREGVAGLIKRYGLVQIAFAFLVVAGLYIWMSSSPLAPLQDQEYGTKNDSRSEKDSVQGLVSLLTRNIPEKDLINVCVSELKKSSAVNADMEKDIIEITGAEASTANPVNTYNAILTKISKKK